MSVRKKGVIMNQKITICINREYGSGGKTIGEMLSENLGIHYYDKEIEKLAADASGINEALFVSAQDDFHGTPLFRSSTSIYTGELLPPSSSEYTSRKNIFNIQAKVIKDLSETQPCIIIGHCGGFILRDRPNVVRIFVHAPHDFLMEKAAEKKSLPPKDLERYIEKENKRRAAYNFYYSGTEWADAHNYDLCLDCSVLGFEKARELVKAYMKVRFDGLEF